MKKTCLDSTRKIPVLMYGIIYTIFPVLIGACQPEVRIETGSYQDRPHFVINTSSAVYWFDRAGGGFSRIIDSEGRDWVEFKKKPLSEYPASAAAGFRGLPNLVYGGENSGAGHPGFDQCVTEKISENQLLTSTKDEGWQWQTTFFPEHAKLEVLKAPEGQPYWFLYEGPIAGDYQPGQHYWGNEQSFGLTTRPDHMKGERALGNFEWVYFGDQRVERVFFIKKEPKDTIMESLSYLGNTRDASIESEDGMVVFGFGRAVEAKPLMEGPGNVFYFGFHDEKVQNAESHEAFSEILEKLD